jgi:transposase
MDMVLDADLIIADKKELTLEFVELKREHVALKNENAELKRQRTELIEEVANLKTKIATLEEQARLYRYRLFGQSSEKTQDPSAHGIVTEIKEAKGTRITGTQPLEKDLEEKPEGYQAYETIEVKAHKRSKRKGKREEDLSGLPVERVEYEIPEEERVCPDCGSTMHDIGVEVRRELKVIPAQYIVVEHAQHKYACRDCEQTNDHTPIIEAEAPAAMIPGSLATPSAVAFFAIQKYVYCVPIYRLEKGFLREGFFLSRQTMNNWIAKCVMLYLIMIYNLMKEELLLETVLHCDETTVQVLREPDRKAKAKSYEWLYRTTGSAERQIVIYEYTQTRGRENPDLFFEWTDIKRFIHSDGYEVYHDLKGVISVGCWVHVRRRFYQAAEAAAKDAILDGSMAEQGLICIDFLFYLEHFYENLTPTQRYTRRLELSKPIADSFFAWAEKAQNQALPGSLIGGAIKYALNQKEYLLNVFLDGRLELSNNRAERSIKPFVMGRKNWLFFNTPAGAEVGSVMYSIIETSLENGLDPNKYLTYLLESLPKTNQSGAYALLPWSTDLPASCRSRANKVVIQYEEDDEY